MAKTQDDRLLQEIYKDDPWKFLASCVLLNKTSREQVDKVRDRFFELIPDAETMVFCEEDTLDEVFELLSPLGLINIRMNRLVGLAEDVNAAEGSGMDLGELVEAEEIGGVGDYARDSWRIFVEGRTDFMPSDKELIRYLEERM